MSLCSYLNENFNREFKEIQSIGCAALARLRRTLLSCCCCCRRGMEAPEEQQELGVGGEGKARGVTAEMKDLNGKKAIEETREKLLKTEAEV